MIGRAAKRCFDLLLASAALVILSPLMMMTAILIRLRLGGPVLFVQLRPGYRGRSFQLFKFRTMTEERDAAGQLLDDDARLGPFGKTLRRFSLDELPQLINVIKGDLSLVGPRPLLMEYLPLYSPEQARRHEVKPGITGWAQINGRNAVSWQKRFEMDVWYVDHQSLWLDAKIMVMTLGRALRGQGINQEGRATVEKFKGNTA